ncbi:MAG: quinol dehydrogenase rane component [Firmicutes bacterium]|nr:quinol dehydrogenase rane component [Bacillota bacterium]
MFKQYLFFILLLFLAIGYFYPAIGLLALLCMLAPIVIAPFKGRYWCGNFCPRGNFYDQVIAKISPQKPIPKFFHSIYIRLVALAIIMTVFTLQMLYAWGNFDAMGLVFLRIIFITTLIGIALGVIYHHRTWCSFCPMGTLATWLSTKRSKPLAVSEQCVSCSLCTKACPFDLQPYTAKGSKAGFTHGDCLKCNRCTAACPKNALDF